MIEKFENLIIEKVHSFASPKDPSHDFMHFQRVVKTAKLLCEQENARPEVVVPAAWLHDMINLPKNHPERKSASRLSALAAVEFLTQINYPSEFFADIVNAIESHSFSAAITPTSIEAKIVQDADRLDAIGAIGIARCFSVGTQMGTSFYHDRDPWAQSRELDDLKFSIDHFNVKLFKLVDMMQTKSGKSMASSRVNFMKSFLKQLESEI